MRWNPRPQHIREQLSGPLPLSLHWRPWVPDGKPSKNILIGFLQCQIFKLKYLAICNQVQFLRLSSITYIWYSNINNCIGNGVGNPCNAPIKLNFLPVSDWSSASYIIPVQPEYSFSHLPSPWFHSCCSNPAICPGRPDRLQLELGRDDSWFWVCHGVWCVRGWRLCISSEDDRLEENEWKCNSLCERHV